MPQHWEKLESVARDDYRVFSVRTDRSVSRESGREHTFYVVEAADWVNIIPITEDGKIVFVRQYRHGTEDVTLEIPGGIVDEGESPMDAARREMLEETGYDSDDVVLLGRVAPNPAIQNNRCYSYLAWNARLVSEQKLDGLEEIEVVLVDPADVPAHVHSGETSHALVVGAFYLYEVFVRERGKAAPSLLP